MKIKFLFITLIMILLLSTCKREIDYSVSSSERLFKGLYTLEYENWSKQHIWIFADDILYTLYPSTYSKYSDPVNNVDYELPVHYYVKEDKLYTCGIDVTTGKATALEKCFNDGSDPDYNIISIDTVLTIDGNGKMVVIDLEDYQSKTKMVLTKHL